MQKTILITGSNGLLGQKLVELLHTEPDVRLIATGRGPNRQADRYPNLTYATLDTTDKEAVREVMAQFKPQHVIHTAAMTNVDQCETEREDCWKQNVDAVRYMAAACAEHKTHLVHLSTDFIFDGEAGPYREVDEPNPVNYYGESKLAAEKVLLESHCNWAIARTVLVYGTLHDGSRSNIVLWVKKSLEEGKPLNLVDDQVRSPTLAEDLAMGCWQMVQQKIEGIYNVSGKDLLTPYQMGLMVAESFNLDASLLTKTDSTGFKQPARRPMRTGFVLDKAIKDFGYNPHSFAEGIKIVAGQVKVEA